MKTQTVEMIVKTDGENELRVLGVVPCAGLLVAPNPHYTRDGKCATERWAIYHAPSQLLAGTTHSKARALEICNALAALANWDLSQTDLFKQNRAMRIAGRLLRAERGNVADRSSISERVNEISASVDKEIATAAAIEQNRKARRKASAAASRARRVKLHNPQTV